MENIGLDSKNSRKIKIRKQQIQPLHNPKQPSIPNISILLINPSLIHKPLHPIFILPEKPPQTYKASP